MEVLLARDEGPPGVIAPEQLLSVPSTLRPLASAAVLTRSVPATGPESCISVATVMRRLSFESGTSAHFPSVRRISATVAPCAIASILKRSGVAFFSTGLPSFISTTPGNIRCGLVYS